MTDKEIRAKISKLRTAHSAVCFEANGTMALSFKNMRKKIVTIQGKCPHRKKSYASGGPYENGETYCDVCGAVL